VAGVSSSGFRTKKALRSELFPTGLPRARKITPKSVRTLHEGGGQKSPKVFYCSLSALKRRLFLVSAPGQVGMRQRFGGLFS